MSGIEVQRQMLKSEINALGIYDREAAIDAYDKAIKDGSLDLHRLMRRQVSIRIREETNGERSIAIGGTTMGGLLLALMMTPIIGVVVGGILILCYGFYSTDKAKGERSDLRDDDWGHLMNDDELRECLAIVQDFGTPATSRIARGIEIIKGFLAEECDFGEGEAPAFLPGGDKPALQPADDNPASAVIDVPTTRGGGSLLTRVQGAIRANGGATRAAMATLSGGSDDPEAVDGAREYLQGGAPAYVEGGKVNPQLLALPPAERAEILLNDFRKSGFHIWPYLNRATLAAGTLQQSGKTTLLVLMGILERALYGRELYMVTTSTHDATVKYPVAWDGLASGDTKQAVNGLMAFADDVSKDEISDRTWILDELSRTIDDEGADDEMRTRLWGVPLTCLAKRARETRPGGGEKMRAIVHGTTSNMCGVPNGKTASFQNEIVLLKGERLASHDGTYHPSGMYEVWNGERGKGLEGTGEYISIPEWLLAINESPVLAILEFFPEQKAENAVSEPKNIGIKEAPKTAFNTEQNLGSIPFYDTQETPKFRPAPPPSTPVVTPSEGGESFQGEHNNVVMRDAAPSAPKAKRGDPMVEGTRYKRSELNRKIKGYVEKESERSEFPLNYLVRKFHSDDKAGVREYLHETFTNLAKTKQERYSYGEARILIIKSRTTQKVGTEN